MKGFAYLIIFILFVSSSFGQKKFPPLGDFKTQSGKVYKNAKISKVAKDHISIIHDEGITRVYYDDIPKELSKQLGITKKPSVPVKKNDVKNLIEKPLDQKKPTTESPFGLRPGMSLEEANKIGANRETNKFGKFSKGATAPYTHRTYFKKNLGSLTGTFKRMQALFDSKMGLIAIETEGRARRDESKTKYTEIIQSLTKKYGKPLGTKKERINPILITQDEQFTTIWPTGKKAGGVIDLSVSWREQAAIGDLIKIRYWFVAEELIREKTDKIKADQQEKKKNSANKELEDL